MNRFVWKFRDDDFISEMLPHVEDLGFDYADDPQDARLIHTEIEGNLVSIYFNALCEAPNLAGLGTRLKQLCKSCELEFLSLSAT